ncbi:MAG: hypothetical protein EOO24_06960, partial [Comamonadaceae bacterium]
MALRHAFQLSVLGAALWIAVILSSAWLKWRPPGGLANSLLGFFLVAAAAASWAARERERLVREAPMPQFLHRKLRETYPHLSAKDTELVERGLRQFFVACQRSRRKFVAMPSRVVDSMWHEFILHTRAYREWCDLVLGRFMDHVPAEALGRGARQNDGLRRAWFWACKDEAIQPRKPSRLPLLFALDAKLGIEGGFHYRADCGPPEAAAAAGIHCGESFSDGSYGGDSDGFGGAASDASGSG